ncbi:MAG TPA: UMP kinase [archaeon]|nr:UMP kinase [archaeon]
MKIVISLGGHLFTKGLKSTSELTAENFKKYADIVKKLRTDGHKVIVVCGGGKFLRHYMKVAKDMGADKEVRDWIGINFTHVNAMMMIAALGNDAYPYSLKTVEELKKHFDDKILVFGGNEPGHSTDYDSAIFAEAINADMLINATTVDGVYSADPKKDPKAKKYDKLSFDEFEKIILKNPQEPGEYRLFDLPGARVVKRSSIKTIIINATDPKEILRVVEGKHRGTVIS